MLLAAVALVVLCGSVAVADEFRGWWIDGWHAGFLSQGQVDQLLGVVGNGSSKGDIRNANLNAVVVEVRRRCDACYPSSMGEPYFTSFNALQAIINAAHDTTGGKQRIEVHCWIVSFPTGGGTVYGLHDDTPTGSLTTLDNYWPTHDDSGTEPTDQPFDPGHPRCEDYTVNVVMDMVNNFDIDGIHYDYIRYLDDNQGYNPTSVARYNARWGTSGQPSSSNSNFQQWRRDQVTAVVRKSYAKIQAVKPWVKQSASVMTSIPSPTASTRSAFFNTPPYKTYYSDWDSWLTEGILDFAVPMDYFEQPVWPNDFTRWLNFQKDRHGNRQMVIGPGCYLNTQSDAISQLLASRTASPNGNYADGFCGYDYYTPCLSVSWSSFSPTLVSQVTPSAANIPSMSWKTSPTKGHISGTCIIAFTGAWSDGASGTIVSITGPESRSMRCDGTGFYAFIDLTPGAYTVTASRPGYSDVSTPVNVAVGSVTGNMYTANLGFGPLPPTTISNVASGSPTNTGATITWTTDQASTSQVDYGLNASYGSSTTLNSSNITSHSQAISGLAPLTPYHYRVRSANSNGTTNSGDYTFTTNGPPTISNVAVSNITATTATITWSTNALSDSRVNYGLTNAYGSQSTNATNVTSHTVTLSSLTPSAEYHYQCVSVNAYGTATSADYVFTTTPAVTEIVVDNSDAGWTNTSPNGNPWSAGTSSVPMIGSGYLTASGEVSATETSSTRRCRWTPNLPASGYYDVYAFYQTGGNRTTAAPYVIHYYNGQVASPQNQSVGSSAYYLLGQNLPFTAGTSGYVELSTLAAGSGVVVDADAAKWVYKSALDLTPPTVSISAPSAALTRGGPISYTITYGGADSVTLAGADVMLNRTSTANGIVAVTGSGTSTRTVTISGITGNGTLGISIAASTASDTAGNFAPAAGPSATFTVDNTAPTVSIGAPSPAFTTAGPVTYTITYSGADSVTLANANVLLNKTGTADGTVAVTGSGTTTRTVTISSITGDGTLGISISAGTASDNAGNTALGAGPSGTCTVDNSPLTISIGAPSGTLTNTGPITYTITYGGASTITLADANVTLNKTGTANGTVDVTGSGTTTRTVTVSGITGDGTIGISIAAGTAGDAVGGTAPAAGPSATFSVDNTAPVVVIGSSSVTSTKTGPVTYLVVYGSANTVTLANANVTLNKTGTANGTVNVTGSGVTMRTVTISSTTGDGTLGISIAAGTAGDNAGNLAHAAGPSTTFTVDNSAPVMTSVTDEIYTTSTSSLQGWWGGSDAGTGIARYEYAVGTSSGGSELKGWTSTGTATSATCTGLSLAVGGTYYISARAVDGMSQTSSPMSSAGVKVARPVTTIQQAKGFADGEIIGLPARVVSAKFADKLYVEEANRVSGIRVQSSAAVPVGQNVTVLGVLGLAGGCERAILSPKVITGTMGTAIKPLIMIGGSVGGEAFNGSTPGITDAVGLYNVGMLVRMAGKVGVVITGGFDLLDGSNIKDSGGNPGLKISTSTTWTTGAPATVTGVVSCESVAGKVYPVILATSITAL